MRLIILGFALATTHAYADTLRADALVCEQPENFSALKVLTMNPELSLKELKPEDTGSHFIKFVTIMKKVRETSVEAARVTGEPAKQRKELANAQDADAWLAQCTATADATVVKVIERRPISGLVKINMLLSGALVDLWTLAAYLTTN